MQGYVVTASLKFHICYIDLYRIRTGHAGCVLTKARLQKSVSVSIDLTWKEGQHQDTKAAVCMNMFELRIVQ